MRVYYIYKITNNVNGKTYIGKRFCPKNKSLEEDKYMGSGISINSSKKKYGIKNFSKEIIAVCYSEDILNILEKQYIALYRSIGKAEYNIADGGDGGNLGEQSLKKIGEKQKEHWSDPEYKERQRKSHLGKSPVNKGTHLSEELKEKYRIAHLNIHHHHSDEFKNKHSEFMKNYWASGKMKRRSTKGSRRSEETKKKMSESLKGKYLGRVPWNKGKHGIYSEDRLKKMSECRKGIKMPREVIEKSIEITRGSKWWNNGLINKRSKVCPGDDFVLGKLTWKK